MKKDLRKKIEESREILEKKPEVIEYLTPFQKQIAQGLMGQQREKTTKGEKVKGKAIPSL